MEGKRWCALISVLISALLFTSCFVGESSSEINAPMMSASIVVNDSEDDGTGLKAVDTSVSDGEVDVEVNIPISFTFSSDINPDTVTPENHFIRNSNGTVLHSRSIVDGNRVILIPQIRLQPYKQYTVTLNGAEDKGGNKIAKTMVTFKNRELDFGLYWFGKEGKCEKYYPNVPNEFYNTRSKTVIFSHGWQSNATGKEDEYGRKGYKHEIFYWEEDNFNGKKEHNGLRKWTNHSWIDKGWNTGIVYWNQFADDDLNAAEARIWSFNGPKGSRFRYISDLNDSDKAILQNKLNYIQTQSVNNSTEKTRIDETYVALEQRQNAIDARQKEIKAERKVARKIDDREEKNRQLDALAAENKILRAEEKQITVNKRQLRKDKKALKKNENSVDDARDDVVELEEKRIVYKDWNRTFIFNGQQVTVNSVGEMLGVYVLDALKKNSSDNIRIVGHSLGNQVACSLTKQCFDNGIMINRIALLDPAWTQGNKDYLPVITQNDLKVALGESGAKALNKERLGKHFWTGEMCRTILFKCMNAWTRVNDFSVEIYHTTGMNLGIPVVDDNAPLTKEVCDVNSAPWYYGALQLDKKHISIRHTYFWSMESAAPPECTISFFSRNKTGLKGPSASTPDWRIREMMGGEYEWTQVEGRYTPDPSDDWFERKTKESGMFGSVWIPELPTTLLNLDETEGIYRVPLLASNAYFLKGKEGVKNILMLVDAGILTDYKNVLKGIDLIGYQPEDLKYIYITHAHVDHYGSAQRLREITGARIICHKDDAGYMARGESPLGDVAFTDGVLEDVVEILAALPLPPTAPDIVVSDGESLGRYGFNATVVHLPGHTPGSSGLLIDSDAGLLAIVGDLVASDDKGAHMQQSYAMDWNQIYNSVDKLQQLEPLYTFPGHGKEVITAEQLQNIE